MAARVGTGATGSGDGNSTTVATAGMSLTAGNFLVGVVKWENVGVTLTSVADTVGSNWQIRHQLAHGSGEPSTALIYAEDIDVHASNVVTATFSGNASWRRIIVEQFSGVALTSSLDGSQQSNTGTTGDYSTSSIATSRSGLVVLGVGDFATLSNLTGAPGDPDFSIGASLTDTFIAYLISGSAQTVTPGAGSDGNTQWAVIAQGFIDAGAVAATRIPFVGSFGRLGGRRNRYPL